MLQHYGDMVVVSYGYPGTFNDTIEADPRKTTAVCRYEDVDWLSAHENRSLKLEK